MDIKHQFKVIPKAEGQTAVQAKKEAKVAYQTAADTHEEFVRQVVVLECGIVGLDMDVQPVFSAGTELLLEREPANPVDRWAIRVKSPTGEFLGYLPSRKNQSVARLIDAGKRIRAFVADSADPAYQDGLKVFQWKESRLHPLRLYMEIPVRKEEEHES